MIIDGSASEIEVQVYHGDYPYISTVKNSHILSKNIEGVCNARNYRSYTLAKLQYRDFKPDNIICDSNGVNWVVDTEEKSFIHPILPRGPKLLQNYLKKRFKVLAGEEYSPYQIFKISLENLSLK